MGLIYSKKSILMYQYPKLDTEKYEGDLPKHSYRKMFSKELASYSLSENLLTKNDVDYILKSFSYKFEKNSWLISNVTNLMKQNLLDEEDDDFRKLCCSDHKLFTTYIKYIKNSTEVSNIISTNDVLIINNMLQRFPHCLYMTQKNSTNIQHDNIIRLIASSHKYDLDNIINNIEWTISDYECMKKENISRKGINKFDHILPMVMDKIKFDKADTSLYINNIILLHKFIYQITQDDKFWKYIKTIEQLELFKEKNVTLPNKLYQQFLDQNNFPCFKWVHKNIPLGELKLSYTCRSFDDWGGNCGYCNELIDEAESVKHFMLYFYYNKDTLNNPDVREE